VEEGKEKEKLGCVTEEGREITSSTRKKHSMWRAFKEL